MGATVLCANISDDSGTESTEKGILKEIHHQVKNNLQVVCSLLRLQSRALKDADARLAFKRSEERIQSMALVYDTLYRGASMFEVAFHDYISDLANQLLRCHSQGQSQVTLLSELEPLCITSKAATTCGLIVNEVLSMRMSAVAALSEEKVIKILLSSDDTRVYLEIYDTAAAWEADGDSRSLSLQILQALVTQLQGAIEFGNGSRGECRICLAKKALISE